MSGYSLAGLFSLYAMHELDLDGAISVSGSLWKEEWLDYLKDGGKIVINDYEIPSSTVLSGLETYPENIIEKTVYLFFKILIFENVNKNKAKNIK